MRVVTNSDRRYFAKFVEESPEFLPLFESWKAAKDPVDEYALAMRLLRPMLANGWG